MALAFLFGFFFTVNLFAQGRLVFAVDVIRHGDRAPTAEFTGADTNLLWPEGLGNLTPEGTNQEHELGSRMRSFYLQSRLLDSNYTAGSIEVFSTDKPRTRASARMFLSGLLADTNPPVPVQTNIPVNINKEMGPGNWVGATKLMSATDRPDYKKLLSKYVLHTSEWRATNRLLQPKFAGWSRDMGRGITNAHDIIIPADTLHIHELHHVPLSINLPPEERRDIMDVGRWAFVYQYEGKLGQVTGKPLLKKITEYLQNAARGKTGLKYVLFSAHDSTLLDELSALKSPLTGANAPPYAALLHFGLFESDRGDFHVEVIYNDGADHTVPTPKGGASWSLAQLWKLAR